jgi:arsenate reductase
MNTTIYHNKRCSKSRQTLALLEEQGVTPDVVLYLETPPDAEKLRAIADMLNGQVTDMVRFKEKRAVELGIKPADQRSPDEWCVLLADNPALLERPIVVHGTKAVIGRPPENVLNLF